MIVIVIVFFVFLVAYVVYLRRQEVEPDSEYALF